MKTTTLALAASTFLPSTTTAQYFGIIAARSASPIHLSALSASSQAIWIGKPTTSYCPLPEPECNCPPGTSTTFAGGSDTLSLAVEVPGGQQVYIAPDGHLAFTQAHSAYIPAGSIQTGFVKSDGEGANFGHVGWTNGFVACPTTTTGGAGGWPYQVFAQREGVNGTGCLGFDALTVNTTELGAWQYT